MFVHLFIFIYIYTVKRKYKIETKGGEMSIWLQVVPVDGHGVSKTKPLGPKTRQVATLNETLATPRTRPKPVSHLQVSECVGITPISDQKQFALKLKKDPVPVKILGRGLILTFGL